MALPRNARRRGPKALERCRANYPARYSFLRHGTAFQLLVAVVLSQQTRDVRVNEVTPALFSRFGTPEAMARADPDEVDALIDGVSYHRTKAQRLVQMAGILVERHHGDVPLVMDDLTSLPGVARKTANVVLGYWGEPDGIAVDTHVRGVSQRLALTDRHDPERIEADLTRLFMRGEWPQVNYQFIQHGRTICHARKPLCGISFLDDLCPKVGVDAAWVEDSHRLAQEGLLAPTPDLTARQASHEGRGRGERGAA